MGINATKKTQKKAKEALVSRLTKRAARHLVNKTDDKAFKPTRGLAFLGALGWNIPIPTFLGILLGRWMDAHHKVNSVSWTLNFLLLGLLIGMAGAWFWLKREGIDYAQKEQERRNALINQTQYQDDETTSEATAPLVAENVQDSFEQEEK